MKEISTENIKGEEKMTHPELVARLATSNISTEDFSYLTTVLMEIKTCENCKHLQDLECDLISDWDCSNDSPANWSPPDDFGCNNWEKKDDSTYIGLDGKETTKWGR